MNDEMLRSLAIFAPALLFAALFYFVQFRAQNRRLRLSLRRDSDTIEST
jgi:preprotein translocase subunit YajC